MTFSRYRIGSLARLSPWFGLGSLGLAAVLATPACGSSPPVTGTGGAATGGAPTSGGAPSSGGTGSGGLGSGGLGSGGLGSGGLGSGGASGGGSSTGGDSSSGGDGSGGTTSGAFSCPPGSDALTPTLTGTPAPLAGTLPPTPGDANGNSIMEGPVWIDGTLYLSQFREYGPLNPSQMVTHDGSAYSIFLPDSGTNGLAVQDSGLILAASHGVGGLVEIDPAAATPVGTTVIAEYMGNRLNSPNDLAIRDDGNVYFTDPDFQCASPCDSQADNRVYRYPAGGGDLEPITTGHANPNGIVLSIDGTKLYVAGGGGIEVYTLDAAGAVTAGPTAFGSGLSEVDGLGKDCAGNIYATANGDLNVLSPTGDPVGSKITVPNATTNVAFGGPSGTVLYITTRAAAGVYTLDVGIPGYPY